MRKLWKGDKCIFQNGAAFGELWPDHDENNNVTDHSLDNIEEVIAWMPLPNIYKRAI